jgi:hypothetical protein
VRCVGRWTPSLAGIGDAWSCPRAAGQTVSPGVEVSAKEGHEDGIHVAHHLIDHTNPVIAQAAGETPGDRTANHDLDSQIGQEVSQAVRRETGQFDFPAVLLRAVLERDQGEA